jgi:hypothetical protein
VSTSLIYSDDDDGTTLGHRQLLETDVAARYYKLLFHLQTIYTTMARFVSFLSLLLVLASSSAWVARVDGRARSYGRATQLFDKIESSSVKGLDNHEEEGGFMAKSIAAWLDAEVR